MRKKIAIIICSVIVTVAILFGICAIGYQVGKHNALQTISIETAAVETGSKPQTETTVSIEIETEEVDIKSTDQKNRLCDIYTQRNTQPIFPIDFRNWGEYDIELPYEMNDVRGDIIYYNDGIYIAFREINITDTVTIEKTEIWDYDGKELYNTDDLLFEAEAVIKGITFKNTYLSELKTKDTDYFTIKLTPKDYSCVDSENWENPIQYRYKISVAIYYTDSNGEEQIAWVQLDNIVTYK